MAKIETEEDVEEKAKPRINLAPVVGVVTGLMMESSMHRHMFLADLEWLVLPPILLGQYRVFRKNGVPVAYASWAKVTKEKEEKIKQGVVKLRPDEWNAGDRNWLIDLVAPFGGEEAILKEIKEKVSNNIQFMKFDL